jgi:isocitrate dehydrogenase kinase/phosphatase
VTTAVALLQLAEQAASALFAGYLDYQREFRSITRRARERFEQRDWRGTQVDARERLECRGRCVRRIREELFELLGERVRDHAVWRSMRDGFAVRIEPLPDRELAATFFNSVTRKVFGTVGVDPAIEFTGADAEGGPPPHAAPLHRVYRRRGTSAELVASILRDRPFRARWRSLEADARLAGAEIDSHLQSLERQGPLDAVEMLAPVFYRNKGAYLVGRIRRGEETIPLLLPVLHEEGGLALDSVLLGTDDAAVVFSFTRSYFLVEVDRPREMVDFLRSIMPHKPRSELYISIGYNKHGKTELFREIQEHLLHTRERFEVARGDRGMVMAVFTLPSLDVVFKVIKDRFQPPKNTTREEVRSKYELVFKHDRAGRMPDAQEFERLAWPRSRFAPGLLEELVRDAGETVRIEGDRVHVDHLYAERRVEPLNLFLRERDEWTARHALLDFGQALRDLAATNTFPGDLLLKNFGVTRTGRVIFYDYDELCRVTDCAFRDLPEPDEDEEMSGEAWFYVGDKDVFPEEFIRFLGLPERLREVFVAAHGDVLTGGFWRGMQERHRAGEVVDLFPYRANQRLPREPPAGSPVEPGGGAG